MQIMRCSYQLSGECCIKQLSCCQLRFFGFGALPGVSYLSISPFHCLVYPKSELEFIFFWGRA